MPRVSADDVEQIIDTSLTSLQIDHHITAANLMVTNRLASSGLSSETLTQIELYLAAHFVTLQDPREKSARVEDAQVTYQGTTGEMLKSSHYGQMALALDSSGQLAQAGKRRASITVYSEKDVSP